MKKVMIIFLCIMLAVSAFAGCSLTTPEGIDPPQTELPVEPPNNNIPDLPSTPSDPNEPIVPPSPPEDNVPDIPTPLPPPKPEISKSVMVMATSTSVIVRSGAGANYSALGTMDSGDRLKYITTQNNWYQVFYKGSKGFVSAKYSVFATFEMAKNSVEKVIAEGEKFLGTPYVFGAQRYHWGNGVLNINFTSNQFDCSSLTQYMYKVGANINIATTSREQSLQGSAVSRTNLKRGDLMFFTNSARFDNVGLERIGHVGMYLGDNYILHTSSDFAVIEPINQTRWSYLINSRRLIF